MRDNSANYLIIIIIACWPSVRSSAATAFCYENEHDAWDNSANIIPSSSSHACYYAGRHASQHFSLNEHGWIRFATLLRPLVSSHHTVAIGRYFPSRKRIRCVTSLGQSAFIRSYRRQRCLLRRKRTRYVTFLVRYIQQ